jgi:hypothetical protein
MQTKTMKETKTMKTKLNHQLVAAVGLLFTLALQPSTLLAQGSLTPPGAPAPTMKTLQQVEPRVPISSAPFTISQPGSYYLTTNLTVSGGDAITIATNGVTLDLNGFTISSTTNPASGTAVLIGSGLRNIAIQNGHIQGGVTNNGSGVFSGPGFGYGIYYSGSAPQNVRVSGVSVSGCQYHGIYVGDGASTTVENCVVRTVGSYGIVASTIRGCVALDCGGSAIYGQQVSDSRGESVGSGYGLYADHRPELLRLQRQRHGLYATTAQNCYGSSSSGYGLYAYNAQNCYGYSSSGYGLYAERTAIGCSGSSGSGYRALRLWHRPLAAAQQRHRALRLCARHCSGGPRGLYAQNAAFCTGYRSGGRAIEATIANGCWAAAGTNLITYKYNMP